jgi:DNA-binding transcriptional LysR family regulator
MELRHLRYFVAVAEELHVTRAAARLHIAQQALSTQIRNLEMELGFDLLVRGSKGVTLTAAGRSFLEGARKTLETAVSSVERARSVAEREANVLRIGFCSYAMKLGLSDAIASFRAHYPEVQIVLDDLPASEQLLRVERGRLDLAICSIPLFRPEIRTVTLASEKLVGLIPPLSVSTIKTPVCLKDYAKLPFIALDRDAYGDYWRYLDQLCRERDVTLEPAHEVKEKHSLLALVAGGMGVSILPAHVAETARGSLRIVPIEDLPDEILIVAAFDTHSAKGMRDYFLDLLKQEVASRRVDLVPERELTHLSSVE